MRYPFTSNCAGEGQRAGKNFISLVPRPFPGGGETAWAPLLAHARRFHKTWEFVHVRIFSVYFCCVSVYDE